MRNRPPASSMPPWQWLLIGVAVAGFVVLALCDPAVRSLALHVGIAAP